MKNSGGFTLIEILISLAIISVSLVTLVSVFDKSIVSTAESREMTGAVMLAEEKLSLAGSMEFPKPGRSEWKEDERYPRYRFRTTVMETQFVGARSVSVEVEMDKNFIFSLSNYVIR